MNADDKQAAASRGPAADDLPDLARAVCAHTQRAVDVGWTDVRIKGSEARCGDVIADTPKRISHSVAVHYFQ